MVIVSFVLTETEFEQQLAALDERLEMLARERDSAVRERDHYQQLAALLQKELERLRDAQKTPREHVDTNELQLCFAELLKHLGAAAPELAPGEQPAANGSDSPPERRARRRTPHGRGLLPEHLPVETIVLAPATEGIVIGEEVAWRLGFRRGGFYRLKIVRPIVVVDAAEPQDGAVSTRLAAGDLSCLVTGPDSTPTAPCAPAPPRPCEPEPGAAQDEPSTAAMPEPKPETTAERAPVGPVEPAQASVSEPADVVPEARSRGRPQDTTVISASAPDEMIPRGLPSVDLLAHVLCGKFADKSPFRRQEGIYARVGVHLTATTMCGWARQCHELARHVVAAMSEDALAEAHWIATDSTGVLVQANEKCRRGHFWVFVSDNGHVVFRYSPKCTHEEPLSFFRGFGGTVIADASSVYDALFRLPDGPTEGGCWAHARRYFFKALSSDRERALSGIGFANKLFELERDFAKLPAAKRLRLRQERADPVIAAFAQWRTEMLAHPEVAAGTAIRRALQYTVNHWDALCRFLGDGRIPIHNNRSELELRRLVVGRANWLFVGSDESAEWTCTFSSLVASCSLHGLDPEAYLRDLFRVLPGWPRQRLLELAPRSWAATRARLDPAELALPLGPLTVPTKPSP